MSINRKDAKIIRVGEYYLTPTNITIKKTEKPILTADRLLAWVFPNAEEAQPVARLVSGKVTDV